MSHAPCRRQRRGLARGLAIAVAFALAFTFAISIALPGSAIAQTGNTGRDANGDTTARILAFESLGRAQPFAAAKSLEAMRADTPEMGKARLELLTVQGLMLAAAAPAEAIAPIAAQLERWGNDPAAPNAAAASASALMVRARSMAREGNLQSADQLMREAMSKLPADTAPRDRYRFLAVHGYVAGQVGQLENAVRINHDALALADEQGQPWQQSEARTALALTYLGAKQQERARSLSLEAIAIATKANDQVALGRARNADGIVLDSLGDQEGKRRSFEQAIVAARSVGAKNDEVRYLANLSDTFLQSGDYKTALAHAERALPLARELKDPNSVTVALSNIGLAHISMQHIELGTRYVQESIAIDVGRGSVTSVSESWRELGSYLEKAGDVAGAVASYHRHRRMAATLLRADQQKAILAMQEQYDADRRSRALVLLNRENDIKAEELRRRDLQQSLWRLLAAVFVLSFAVVALLYRRVRQTNRLLSTSNEMLKVQSERDPLTGLANRRHFQAAIRHLATDGKLNGTVYLIDIDHFKQINDRHGHGTGDAVLVEVARRLRETLREQDLIVRWGGEEFLVVVQSLEPEQVEALAQRMLGVLDREPVVAGAQRIPVTASIGFATFPIGPGLLRVSWERAIDLVDTAMYLAKAHGRNRAYGVRLLHAQDEAALEAISHSLEAAWRDGAGGADLAARSLGTGGGRMKALFFTLARLALLGTALSGIAAMAAMPAPYRPNPFAEQIDELIYQGFEHPEQALPALRQLSAGRVGTANEQRILMQAAGTIEAQTGGTARAGAIAEKLLSLAPNDPASRTAAASNLVRALVAENAGQLDVAGAFAQSALPAFQEGCPGAPPTAVQSDVECNYRAAWRALQILERKASSQGLTVTATAHAQSALVLAEWAGDARRSSVNLSSLSLYAHSRGEREASQRLLAQARRAALQTGDPADRARVVSIEARLARAQGDRQAALRLFADALALARRAQASRLEAMLLINLSDTYASLNRPAEALQSAERALVTVRRFNDLRNERVLINNAGIAKIGLGRIADGKRDLARLIDLWQESGETGRQANTLLEFGEALAAAGDSRSALELYHRERALNAGMMRANRDVALKELQTRNEADARQRDIELLGRDNALKTAAIANRDLLQRIWWLLAAVMALAIALAAMLYRRVRETHQRLEASHLQLQSQSELDPLTNLANRRHFQAVMTKLCANGGFEGALLLVDIDHFKHVNDAHGHAAGDQVLVEVAKRLNEAVRSEDLVVRWGGEEFLILAPQAANEQAEQMAARVLRILGQTPIVVGSGTAGAESHALRVTASIGYGRFPLPPYGTAVPWEQAVNLADMALYTAKNQGRNRAVGISSSTASSEQALRDVEADFDRAWREGRVTLLQTPGRSRATTCARPSANRP